jgi:hypothetical protein
VVINNNYVSEVSTEFEVELNEEELRILDIANRNNFNRKVGRLLVDDVVDDDDDGDYDRNEISDNKSMYCSQIINKFRKKYG